MNWVCLSPAPGWYIVLSLTGSEVASWEHGTRRWRDEHRQFQLVTVKLHSHCVSSNYMFLGQVQWSWLHPRKICAIFPLFWRPSTAYWMDGHFIDPKLGNTLFSSRISTSEGWCHCYPATQILLINILKPAFVCFFAVFEVVNIPSINMDEKTTVKVKSAESRAKKCLIPLPAHRASETSSPITLMKIACYRTTRLGSFPEPVKYEATSTPISLISASSR